MLWERRFLRAIRTRLLPDLQWRVRPKRSLQQRWLLRRSPDEPDEQRCLHRAKLGTGQPRRHARRANNKHADGTSPGSRSSEPWDDHHAAEPSLGESESMA